VISVAIDATPLLGARTGVGAVVAGMIETLAQRGRVSLRAYGFTATGTRALAAAVPNGVPVQQRPMPARFLLRVWAHTEVPPAEWWTGRADVVHGTNFVVPPSRRAGRVVTVHDLTAVHFPQLCTPDSRRYPALVARAVADGAWVHAVSRFVADDVIEHLGADPSRVRVIHPGLATSPAGTTSPQPTPYVLALGTVEPRKDLPTLVAAFDHVASTHGDIELLIAGPAGWGEDDLTAAMAQAKHRARIRRLGWVEDRAALLRDAAVLCYPSLYEGFGLPPLEAMAAGVPVVATAAGALPEVLGDAAVLVPPGDAGALAAGIQSALSEPTRLIHAGRQQAARYQWDDAAARLEALYEDAAAAR
jgi:glycosyltransferase involved in cell wall biosynthesis